jgi:hypothetical protein
VSDLSGLARILIVSGALLVGAGVVLLVAPRIPGLNRLGRLPGDVFVERGPVTIFIPIVSSILISLLLTIVLNIFWRR